MPDPLAALSDEALVARYRALAAAAGCAEREAIVALLYERHRQWVGAEAWRRLGSAFGPLYWQDVLQDTFLTTWRRMHAGEEQVYSFRGLLADSLRKRVADRLDQLCQGARLARAQARGGPGAPPPGAVRTVPLDALGAADRSRLDHLADPTGDVEEQAGSDELAAVLARLVPCVPEPYRSVVIARRWRELSVDATAAELGLTPDQVKKYTQTGLRWLAEHLPGGSDAWR
ncbi:MAG TPA: sigma-70 family RNA polymerase sigma factor [Chloroflexota bacterium]